MEWTQDRELQLQLYFESMALRSFTLIKSQILLIHRNYKLTFKPVGLVS